MILSVCIGIFDSKTKTDKIIDALNQYKYNGIELLGEPNKYNISELKKMLKAKSIKVTALTACARLKTGRDLASKDKAVRQKTIEHYKKCLYMACDLSTSLVGVSLTAVGRYWIEDDYYSEKQRALESLDEIIEEAKKLRKIIIIETLNRYVSFMMNSVLECKEFILSNKLKNVGICGDLFHMNIEETNLSDAIRQSSRLLKNIHIADSNRQGIGYGHLNIKAIFDALLAINYQGPYTLESWAMSNNPYSNVDSSFQEIKGYMLDFSKYCRNFPKR